MFRPTLLTQLTNGSKLLMLIAESERRLLLTIPIGLAKNPHCTHQHPKRRRKSARLCNRLVSTVSPRSVLASRNREDSTRFHRSFTAGRCFSAAERRTTPQGGDLRNRNWSGWTTSEADRSNCGAIRRWSMRKASSHVDQ